MGDHGGARGEGQGGEILLKASFGCMGARVEGGAWHRGLCGRDPAHIHTHTHIHTHARDGVIRVCVERVQGLGLGHM